MPKHVSKKEIRKALKNYREEQELKPYQAELIKLQRHLEKNGQKMIILFDGRDAAGKGGTIRRVTQYMNEKHYRVVALGKPTEEQKTQWYFQKYVEQFPRAGEIVLFDRSWYNRAMVERVFGFCSETEYTNFMKGVKGFEKDLVQQGVLLLKLYFSVTKKVQEKRFKRRKTDPLRQWKLSEIDRQAQEKWDEFTQAKYNVLKNTSSSYASWKVIRSDKKHLARLEAIKVVLATVDYEGRNPDLDYTINQNIVISAAREVETMDANGVKNKIYPH